MVEDLLDMRERALLVGSRICDRKFLLGLKTSNTLSSDGGEGKQLLK